jgi:hypothetical protein
VEQHLQRVCVAILGWLAVLANDGCEHGQCADLGFGGTFSFELNGVSYWRVSPVWLSCCRAHLIRRQFLLAVWAVEKPVLP